MFKLITTSAIVSLLSLGICLAAPPEGGNVLPSAKGQMERIGDAIIRMGSIQAGPQQAVQSALMGIPDDDDDKFHATLLISQNPAYKDACDKAVSEINAGKMDAWFIPSQPLKSHCNYQCRLFEDPVQKKWVEGVFPLLFPRGRDDKPLPLLDAKKNVVAPFPALVIKPPLNGRYGENDLVVTLINGNTSDWSGRVQTAIEEWMLTYQHAEIPPGSIGGNSNPNPFAIPQTVQPDPSAVRQWPEKRFNQPKPLTTRQIKELIPDSTKEFRADLLERELTDPADVKAAWIDYRESELKKKQDDHDAQRRINKTSIPPVNAGVEQVDEIESPPAQPPNFHRASGEQPAIDLMQSSLFVLLLLGIIPAWLPLINAWRNGTTSKSSHANRL